jgi:hypothetical protein
MVHAAAVHVVREMVDLHEPGALQRLWRDRLEIDVVDGAFAITIDEVDQ